MKLDRYSGQQPKFRVFRRDDGQNINNRERSAANSKTKVFTTLVDGKEVRYVEVAPFDYFVLALKDKHTEDALFAYANSAKLAGNMTEDRGQLELSEDVMRLAIEVRSKPDKKLPD